MNQHKTTIAWWPLEHACGCAVDWGYAQGREEEDIARWLKIMSGAPCPWHNSPPHDLAVADGVGFYVPSIAFWYRRVDGDLRKAAARRNRFICLTINEEHLGSGVEKLRADALKNQNRWKSRSKKRKHRTAAPAESHRPDLGVLPENTFWLALEHECGCAVDWGVESKRKDELPFFFAAVVRYPCPWHGSATGKTQGKPPPGKEIHLVAHDLWYRALEDADVIENARRNRQVAMGVPGAANTSKETP